MTASNADPKTVKEVTREAGEARVKFKNWAGICFAIEVEAAKSHTKSRHYTRHSRGLITLDSVPR